MKINGNISNDEIVELILNNKLTIKKFKKALDSVKPKKDKKIPAQIFGYFDL